VLAAYTHYFSCVAVVVIYFGILLFEKCDKKIIKKWILSVLVSCFLYIPWIFVFIRQFGKVLGDYWIGEITINSIYDYFRFLFEPRIEKFYLDIILGIALATLYIILLYITVKELNNKFSRWELWGSAVLILTVLLGIIVSLIARPIFVSRYMIVAAGCFWFCFAWLCAFNKRKKILLCCCCLIVCLVSIINVAQFVRWEGIRKDYYDDFSVVLKEIDKNDIVLADGEHMQGCLSYYLNDMEVFEVSNLQTIEFVDPVIEKNDKIWCFLTNVNQSTIDELTEKYTLSSLGTHHLEYYTFEVFCVEN